MHHRHLLLSAVVAAACLLFFWGSPGQEVAVVTGDLPPYSYVNEGKLEGVATDIVRELMRRTNHPGEIQMKPYLRAVSEAMTNSFIYPITRTKSRESEYHWIGPLMKDRLVFAVRASDPRKFDSIEDFEKVKVGVNRGAPPHEILLSLGHTGIDTTTTEQQNLKKLLVGRIDAWFSAEMIIKGELSRLGADRRKVKIAFSYEDTEIFIAGDRNIDPALFQRWQAQLDAMKRDGSYQAILERYHIDRDHYSLPFDQASP